MSAPAVHDLDLDLDAFEGPFDLLLTLVLKDELALTDVQVAEIVIAFVAGLRGADAGPGAASPGCVPAEEAGSDVPRDPELPGGAAHLAPADLQACGEFLVLAAALLELKAREVFAGDEELDLDDLDPDEAAQELAARLAEYRRFRAGAGWLEQRLEAEADRFFRLGPAPLAPVPVRELRPQEPASLAGALRALAAEPPVPSLAHLALKLPPLERFLERFRALVRHRRRFLFDEEVDGLSRIETAVAFLALLELGKAGEIRLGQTAPFEPITVWKAA